MSKPKADELPGVDEYLGELADRSPTLAHRVCINCYPDEPHPGALAVCGYKIKGTKAKRGDYNCLACAKAWRGHVLQHMMGR